MTRKPKTITTDDEMREILAAAGTHKASVYLAESAKRRWHELQGAVALLRERGVRGDDAGALGALFDFEPARTGWDIDLFQSRVYDLTKLAAFDARARKRLAAAVHDLPGTWALFTLARELSIGLLPAQRAAAELDARHDEANPGAGAAPPISAQEIGGHHG